MNRTVFEKLIEWNNKDTDAALLLHGAPGTGKTYLSLELAKNYHENFLYLNPQNEAGMKKALLSLNEQEHFDFSAFLQEYYQIPAEWLSNFLIILDDCDCSRELFRFLERLSENTASLRLFFITTRRPSDILFKQCLCYELSPLEFDEYLKAIGSEWYTEIIQAHYQTKKRIPEIVHKEMLNLFRDYLRIGGMPAAVNEFLHTDNLNNVASVQRNLYRIFLSRFHEYEESSRIRMNQLMEHLPEQLLKENKNYRYNLIRKGATHGMYRTELAYLSDLHIINKIERADFLSPSGSAVCHDNQFRIYPNDSGILSSLLLSQSDRFCMEESEEDSSDTSMQSAPISEQDRLYQLLLEAYLLQTLCKKNYNPVFWESGSLAKIDFIARFDNCIVPIDAKFYENKRSKSLHVFCKKIPVDICMKFGLHNFDSNSQIVAYPIYTLFCL